MSSPSEPPWRRQEEHVQPQQAPRRAASQSLEPRFPGGCDAHEVPLLRTTHGHGVQWCPAHTHWSPAQGRRRPSHHRCMPMRLHRTTILTRTAGSAARHRPRHPRPRPQRTTVARCAGTCEPASPFTARSMTARMGSTLSWRKRSGARVLLLRLDLRPRRTTAARFAATRGHASPSTARSTTSRTGLTQSGRKQSEVSRRN